MKPHLSRRGFLTGASAAGVALQAAAADAGKPALLGGSKVRTEPFPAWPVSGEAEERALMDVLHSGKWFRGSGQNVKKFEQEYARVTGAKQSLATCNGTAALFISLNVLGVEPGDEVIVPPYTFIATINTVLRSHALPVFVDTDPATFQIDATKMEAAITPGTRAIMPVHLGGNVCDIDAIAAIGARHRIPVIEDACQAHLAEWKGRKVGTYGATGCFSFQASKNLTAGEGGAVLTNDDELAERLYSFHNNCLARQTASFNFTYRGTRGTNLRLTEFQAGLLLAQMTRLEQQSKMRDANAAYLAKLLGEIPGILVAKNYDGCTRNAHHLFMFRYQKEQFAGLPRAKFLSAMAAEGIPCSGGYSPLNTETFIQDALKSR